MANVGECRNPTFYLLAQAITDDGCTVCINRAELFLRSSDFQIYIYIYTTAVFMWCPTKHIFCFLYYKSNLTFFLCFRWVDVNKHGDEAESDILTFHWRNQPNTPIILVALASKNISIPRTSTPRTRRFFCLNLYRSLSAAPQPDALFSSLRLCHCLMCFSTLMFIIWHLTKKCFD